MLKVAVNKSEAPYGEVAQRTFSPLVSPHANFITCLLFGSSRTVLQTLHRRTTSIRLWRFWQLRVTGSDTTTTTTTTHPTQPTSSKFPTTRPLVLHRAFSIRGVTRRILSQLFPVVPLSDYHLKRHFPRTSKAPTALPMSCR